MIPPPRTRVSQVVTSPAPVGGWNQRDSFTGMPPQDAVILDNFFPSTTNVTLRNGFTAWCTGLGGNVETLMTYDGGSNEQLFAAANGKIWNVSNKGAPTSAATGFTVNRWQYTKFGTPGGQFLVAVNGADAPQQYDGTSWTNSTITGSGLTPSTLVDVCAYEQHLFFAQTHSLGFWYLPVTQVTGTAAYFDLSSLLTLGGYLMKIAVWTLDGGQGTQNYCCFITSRGQVAVYQGLDPGQANMWQLIGIYRIGEPIGRRCAAQWGGDLLVITLNGVFPLSQALITSRSSPKVAITDKISAAFNTAAASYSSNFGWQIMLYPAGPYGLVNIPTQPDATAVQYVWNLITNAWCSFSGQEAICWELFNEGPYFGDPNGNVMQADYGSSNNGAVIAGECLPAFNSFESPGNIKTFLMARPIFTAGSTVAPQVNINVDFDTTKPTGALQPSQGGGTAWDTALWDTFPWAGSASIRQSWFSVNGLGHWAALHLLVSSSTQTIAMNSIDYMFQIGGNI